MSIRNQCRTITLASMLAISIMSPLAAHVHAAPNDAGTGSGSGSASADCSDKLQAYQSTDGKTHYDKGASIPSGTQLNAVDGNGNVNKYATYKCDNGNIVVALVIQSGRFRLAGPVSGAGALP